jgi:aminoglycoside/choline kinase family phosphotransferase
VTIDPDRLHAMQDFAARALSDDTLTFEPASADASFRSYWRATSKKRGGTWVIMNAPPGRESLGPWLDVARRLRAANLNAPQVYAQDEQQGFVLMSDLGSRTYLWELDEASADTLYAPAFDALVAMQTRVDASGLPAYDESLLAAEMELFPTWFLTRHLGIEPGCSGWDRIESVFTQLIDSALEQPTAFVHRDYHSRNLMIVPGQMPGIVDFQDAVVGPVTYDLVSLVRDCYIEWPPERVYAWANAHRDRLVDKGVLKFGELRWKRWFDFMGLQRHLKVLGIFCRLWYRDGKRNYLDDLPLVWKYTRTVGARHPETAALVARIEGWLGDRAIAEPAP